jgi:hypothetical protein
MMRRLAINLLAVIVAAFRIVRRREEVSAREIVAAKIAAIAERKREISAEPDGRAIAAAQAAWARSQERIASERVIGVCQSVRSTITHTGAVAARAELDRLQRLAEANPEGVPGAVVADARLQFDSLMRANIQ